MSAAVEVIGMCNHGRWKYFSRADVRDASVVFLPLTLGHVHWFIRAPEIALMMLTMPIIPEPLELGASCFGCGGAWCGG
jgi:hypothetical protein